MENKTSMGIFALVGLFATVPFSIIYSGYVLSYLWLWFLTPLGLPIISTAHAIGIMGIKGFMFAKYAKSNNEDALASIIFAFISPTVSLGFGYIIHNWFM